MHRVHIVHVFVRLRCNARHMSHQLVFHADHMIRRNCVHIAPSFCTYDASERNIQSASLVSCFLWAFDWLWDNPFYGAWLGSSDDMHIVCKSYAHKVSNCVSAAPRGIQGEFWCMASLSLSFLSELETLLWFWSFSLDSGIICVLSVWACVCMTSLRYRPFISRAANQRGKD